jgi:hypothetical protein
MSNAADPNQSDETVLSLVYRSCWIDHADKKGGVGVRPLRRPPARALMR